MAADRYLSDADVVGRLGQPYVDAAVNASGADLSNLAEDATAVIQADLRKSGYATPAGQTDADIAAVDPYIKLATIGVLREMLAQVPASAIPLPEAWAKSPAKMAHDDIKSGDAALALTPTQIGSVGAMQFSVDPNVTTRAQRGNLVGY